METPRFNRLVGNFLRKIRNSRGLSQTEVGKILRSDPDTVGRYENAQSSPTHDWLQRWSHAMELTESEERELKDVAFSSPNRIAELHEREFLNELAKPSLMFGGTDIQTKLVPTFLWDEPRQDHLYIDDPEERLREGGRPIELEWMMDATLREDLLAELMADMQKMKDDYEKKRSTINHIEYRNMCDVYERISRGHSNPYPRPVTLPELIPNDNARMLRIGIAPSKYGINHIAERHLPLQRARELRERHVLSSLALRVAHVCQTNDGNRWMECHQRTAGSNATWPLAWDTGAGGYFDPLNHADPEDPRRISPWKGCVDELQKELNIPDYELAHRDHFFFFGLSHDMPTGTVILCGYCYATYVPNPNRPTTELVQAYDRCLLDPESMADFILRKHKWVPSAILTSILTLEAFGFERERIEKAYTRLAGQIDLSPD